MCHPRHDRISILLCLQYMSPMASDIYSRVYYQASSMCYPWYVHMSILLNLQCIPPTTSGIHTKAYQYHDSSMCHPWWVTYMQKHITTSPVHDTHEEWHACKSTMLKTQVRQFLGQSSKGLTKPRSALGESHWFTPPCFKYLPLCKRRVCKSKPVCIQYMPPIVSTLYARAQHLRYTQDSSKPSSVLAGPYRSKKPKARPW